MGQKFRMTLKANFIMMEKKKKKEKTAKLDGRD